MTPTNKARALAQTIVLIWNAWDDGKENILDDALRVAFETARTIDIHQVAGEMASPLNYFARAYLDDENPEDLTYAEMIQALEISLTLPQSVA